MLRGWVLGQLRDVAELDGGGAVRVHVERLRAVLVAAVRLRVGVHELLKALLGLIEVDLGRAIAVRGDQIPNLHNEVPLARVTPNTGVEYRPITQCDRCKQTTNDLLTSIAFRKGEQFCQPTWS